MARIVAVRAISSQLMRHLPYRITTTTGRKFRTSHGLTSCRRAFIIDAYDIRGNQHIVHTQDIQKHSAGLIVRNEKPPEPCGYCSQPYEAVAIGNNWPFCSNCGGV